MFRVKLEEPTSRAQTWVLGQSHKHDGLEVRGWIGGFYEDEYWDGGNLMGNLIVR